MQIHVDPLGGWSGDMFVAAVLDAFPDLWPVVQDAVVTVDLGPQGQCRLVPHRDKALVGHRFVVAADAGDHGHEHTGHAHDAHHDHGDHHHHEADHAHDPHGHHHEHRAWASIRQSIQDMPLTGAIKAHAIGIFGLLAEAEAAVHGVSPDDVTFHEVGAVDSIVDIVVAAVLIDRLGATRWTSAPLPLGSGRVRTAHGILPVPAPATALLLRGLETIDDGIPGERVTPTGAAVARYLLLDRVSAVAAPRRLSATGTGFGTRSMPGISNCLRMLAFEEIQAERPSVGLAATFGHRELAVLEFEVDDQSAEDLTHGLDHLRAAPGVHDVIQSVAFGKKGRMATHVQVLVAPEQRDAVIALCFEETTTIGLRYHAVHGAALVRRFDRVEVEGHQLQVKMVTRPSGVMTGKTEAADVAAQLGHANRARLRHAGEAGALARAGSTDRPADGDR